MMISIQQQQILDQKKINFTKLKKKNLQIYKK